MQYKLRERLGELEALVLKELLVGKEMKTIRRLYLSRNRPDEDRYVDIEIGTLKTWSSPSFSRTLKLMTDKGWFRDESITTKGIQALAKRRLILPSEALRVCLVEILCLDIQKRQRTEALALRLHTKEDIEAEIRMRTEELKMLRERKIRLESSKI